MCVLLLESSQWFDSVVHRCGTKCCNCEFIHFDYHHCYKAHPSIVGDEHQRVLKSSYVSPSLSSDHSDSNHSRGKEGSQLCGRSSKTQISSILAGRIMTQFIAIITVAIIQFQSWWIPYLGVESISSDGANGHPVLDS